jgi:thiaminase/transcriptional activator TenA
MPSSSDSFTEYLRQTHLSAWQNATNNRFTEELVTDSIDPKVYARYLTLDYAFIDGLVATFGHAVAVAPGMPAKARFSKFLEILTSEENDYFLRTFKALGLSVPSSESPILHPVVDAFNALMAQQRAAGSYLDVLALLVTVEWVYLQWATDAVKSSAPAPERFYLSEWITLHADPAFADFVNWMRSELDREAAQADDYERAQAEAAFVKALELETYFFAAPYEDS